MKFGSVTAVNSVSLDIAQGEFLALLGPSGSGKSTVLMGVAGFEFPTSGQILIGGRDFTRVPPHRRNIGMVFQHYTLFPHLSVLDNVAFPLKMRGFAKRQRHERARAALATVRLEGFAERMPTQLSGGQQQRVALARAIVYEPQVLLMDEPLSALDKNLREEMQLEIKRLHETLGMTIIFVTHDQSEALTMADRVAILRNGEIQQIAPARELYERPANLFSAGFIGEMNLIPATLAGNTVALPGGIRRKLPVAAIAQGTADGPVTLAIRPERFSLVEVDSDAGLQATLEEVVYAGAGTLLITRLADGTEIRARVASASLPAPSKGDRVHLGFADDALLIYPASQT
ncbi:ABC transporter ATP-binding protein [Pukyongiella litopenaei]|uniref:Spermidine/putrescine import ATP-binding protein PotA n=1 Tax=Pukyongiella litopenaei TaxID=2605946 RepID=A0A2S0MQR5_9RHOB|nr:ABC transporter ATP-binding protein [Pukyongiella litopenaei]AVO38212.1 ABC transporter ATP-binding protein [Pukyongiella litopenaei]